MGATRRSVSAPLSCRPLQRNRRADRLAHPGGQRRRELVGVRGAHLSIEAAQPDLLHPVQ